MAKYSSDMVENETPQPVAPSQPKPVAAPGFGGRFGGTNWGSSGLDESISALQKQQQDLDEAARINAGAKRKAMEGAIGAARDFGNQLPGYQSDLYNQIEGSAKTAVADQQNDIRKSANSRGLLYSGLRSGAESRMRGDMASQTAQKKSKVSTELNAMREDLNNQAAKMAQQNYANDLQISSEVYDLALNASKDRAANMNAIGGAVGSVAGSYFGRKKEANDG